MIGDDIFFIVQPNGTIIDQNGKIYFTTPEGLEKEGYLDSLSEGEIRGISKALVNKKHNLESKIEKPWTYYVITVGSALVGYTLFSLLFGSSPNTILETLPSTMTNAEVCAISILGIGLPMDALMHFLANKKNRIRENEIKIIESRLRQINDKVNDLHNIAKKSKKKQVKFKYGNSKDLTLDTTKENDTNISLRKHK